MSRSRETASSQLSKLPKCWTCLRIKKIVESCCIFITHKTSDVQFVNQFLIHYRFLSFGTFHGNTSAQSRRSSSVVPLQHLVMDYLVMLTYFIFGSIK